MAGAGAAERALVAAAARLGLSDEPRVIRKACEYERLLQTRLGAGGVINETCKNVICLHLAANTLAVGVDTVSAMKYSGVKKPAYQSMFSTAERLLQLQQKYTVSSVCLQQQCVSAAGLAARILDEMSRVQELDAENPQYVCMAVYQACRLSKIKVSKAKLMAASRLKPAQWAKLEADWGKAAGKCVEKGHRSVHADIAGSLPATGDHDLQNAEVTTKERKSKETVEDFDSWKRRVLQEAYKELKLLQMNEDLQMKGRDLQTKASGAQLKESNVKKTKVMGIKETYAQTKERGVQNEESEIGIKETDVQMKEIESVVEGQVSPRKSPRKRIETPQKLAAITPKVDRTKGVRLLFS